MKKFVLMSFFTMGLYDVYWFYWNWRRQREMSDPMVRAGLYAFLSPFVAFIMFRDIHREAGPLAKWSPGLLAFTYFLLLISFITRGWWWLLTLLSFVPLIPVQQTINDMHAASGSPEAMDERLSVGNIVGLVAGAFVMALLVILNVMISRGAFTELEESMRLLLQ